MTTQIPLMFDVVHNSKECESSVMQLSEWFILLIHIFYSGSFLEIKGKLHHQPNTLSYSVILSEAHPKLGRLPYSAYSLWVISQTVTTKKPCLLIKWNNYSTRIQIHKLYNSTFWTKTAVDEWICSSCLLFQELWCIGSIKIILQWIFSVLIGCIWFESNCFMDICAQCFKLIGGKNCLSLSLCLTSYGTIPVV